MQPEELCKKELILRLLSQTIRLDHRKDNFARTADKTAGTWKQEASQLFA